MLRHISLFARSDRRRRRIAVSEIQALDPDIRAGVLAESGLSLDEFRAAIRAPFFSKDLLAAALGSMGIGPDAFRSPNGSWYRDMQLTCLRCHARKRCWKDIASRRFISRHQDYCLNADSLAGILSARNGKSSPAGAAPCAASKARRM